MGSFCCCCCCATDTKGGGGVYNKVSYYDEEEDDELTDIVSLPSSHTYTEVHTAGNDTNIDGEGAEEDTTNEKEQEDADSVEDPLYYTQYRVVPSPIVTTLPPHAERSEDMARENYERALATFCSDAALGGGGVRGHPTLLTQAKKNLIYEYEEHKSNCFNIEYRITGESLLGEARKAGADPVRQRALYREAIWHTTDLERKKAVKQEYNEVYRKMPLIPAQ